MSKEAQDEDQVCHQGPKRGWVRKNKISTLNIYHNIERDEVKNACSLYGKGWSTNDINDAMKYILDLLEKDDKLPQRTKLTPYDIIDLIKTFARS